MMTVKSLFRRATALAKRSHYKKRYSELEPRDYTAERFRAVAEHARDLLAEANRQLPALPEGALQPCWINNLKRIRRKLQRPLGEHFLSEPELRETMVRRGWTSNQQHELAAVQRSGALLEKISAGFKESRVGAPHLECSSLCCSSATLGYFYYLTRLGEFRKRCAVPFPESVAELGGGYGGFTRAYMLVHAPQQYIIVDLPEYNSVQYVFLTLSLPGIPVKMLTRPDDKPLESGISLYPVNLLCGLTIRPRCDFFTSTFALTESGDAVRQIVYSSRFFGAREVYYAGQTSARWPVSVDPEIAGQLSQANGWQTIREPFYLNDCVEFYAFRSARK